MNYGYTTLKCANCEEHAKKDLACHLCEKVGYVKARIVSLTQEELVVPLMELECSGFEPMGFVLGKGWKAQNPKIGSKFDVDLSSMGFSDYDVKGNCPVAILDARATIRILPTKPKTGSKFDVDLSNMDFSDYDVKGNCPVAILDARATIRILPTKVKKAL
ncbi:hypothetical protein POM88_035073 [Heracleum sosnowskyi]|uniref:Uncharacterized protein n=1 Tax=Heracleum sosnowskyi TaxID=360622 RepID=A0AAD8HLR4_9APIA|nr:hypothetical protein POM88_035073 [Heracleum sosnowskyi]